MGCYKPHVMKEKRGKTCVGLFSFLNFQESLLNYSAVELYNEKKFKANGSIVVIYISQHSPAGEKRPIVLDREAGLVSRKIYDIRPLSL